VRPRSARRDWPWPQAKAKRPHRPHPHSSPPSPATISPKPLKFDPAKLTGLSEKLLTSHWQNNYQGSVKGLNTVGQKLAGALAD
jgi:hypothetical protein